jgi:hypothetical protein
MAPSKKQAPRRRPSAAERERRKAQSNGLESARRSIKTSRFKDFDAAAEEAEPIEFRAGGREYSVPGDPPIGPLLDLIAEGKFGNAAEGSPPDPQAAIEILEAVLGRKIYAELLGRTIATDTELLEEATEILRRVHDASIAELESSKAQVWDDIAELLTRIDEANAEPGVGEGVGLKKMLEIVEWLMDKLGYNALAEKYAPEGDDSGNGSRSPVSSSSGER